MPTGTEIHRVVRGDEPGRRDGRGQSCRADVVHVGLGLVERHLPPWIPAQRTPSPAFAGVQYPPYNYSPPAYASSPTPHFRRCALPFSHLGDTDDTGADMDDIIATGSTAAAASPGFATQDEVV